MIFRFLSLLLLTTSWSVGFYPDFQKRVVEKKMWSIDNQMHRLLKSRIVLAEKLQNITNNESLYDYQSERNTINRLQEKGEENEKALVSSIWTLMNNFNRRH